MIYRAKRIFKLFDEGGFMNKRDFIKSLKTWTG